jgi:peroxiredoxin
MKNKISIGLLGLVLLLAGCGEKGTRVRIKTDFEIAGGTVLQVFQFFETGLKPVDTLELFGKHEIGFMVNVTEPTFYRIQLKDDLPLNLIISPTDKKVNVTVAGTKVAVAGSEESETVNTIDGILKSMQEQAMQMNQQANDAQASGDFETISRLTGEYNQMQVKAESDIKMAVRNANPSFASLYGLNFLSPERHLDFFDSIVSSTHAVMPGQFYAEQMKLQMDEMIATAVGRQAPDFTLPTPDGDMLSLSSLRGKYVLIDFWAAWCKPCRYENPNVVRMYAKFKSDKFEILGVSLDRTREAWLKAIEDDGLKWLHVSDLKYFSSEAAALYKVNAIPATFLVDPDGKIIAKNLRGPALENKLIELFGN